MLTFSEIKSKVKFTLKVIKAMFTDDEEPSSEDDRFQKYCEEIESYEYNIFDFDRKIPEKNFTKLNPTEEGHYLTIRLGYSGIYTNVNYWKDGHWMGMSLDGSNVIARTIEPLKLKYYTKDL